MFEITIVTGVDNSETSQQYSLLGINEKRHSLLRKLLHISEVYLKENLE